MKNLPSLQLVGRLPVVGRLLLLVVVGACAVAARGYSVLSHEEVVDMAWTGQILPLLRQQYPGLTPEQVTEAHSYAYGGSIIQDLGYYPFGDKEFSDLLHYVRSGDFVAELLRAASTADELAFALGALAHYYGDTIGHPVVNVVTGEEYPKLQHRFGRIVTYGDDQTAHLRTEFGFDVVEVAHGNYSQQNYRDFIGFKVSKDLLAKAFLTTYGLPMGDVLKHEDMALGTYRYAVSTLIPDMTKVALASYHQQIESASPGFNKRKFIYRMRRTEFEKTYGKQYVHASFGERVVALLLRLVPKVGPFRALQLHLPNAKEQTEYLTSVNHAEDAYRATVVGMTAAHGAAPTLPELDFDTGAATAEGEYPLADKTYAWWVEQLAKDDDAQATPVVLATVNGYYSNAKAKDGVKAKPKRWAKLQAALGVVRRKGAGAAPTVQSMVR